MSNDAVIILEYKEGGFNAKVTSSPTDNERLRHFVIETQPGGKNHKWELELETNNRKKMIVKYAQIVRGRISRFYHEASNIVLVERKIGK